MFCTEGFESNTKLHGRASVDADKLVVLELDDVAAYGRDDTCHLLQFARFVRQQNRNREDPVAVNESLLDDRGHCDDIHIAARKNAGNFFTAAVELF